MARLSAFTPSTTSASSLHVPSKVHAPCRGSTATLQPLQPLQPLQLYSSTALQLYSSTALQLYTMYTSLYSTPPSARATATAIRNHPRCASQRPRPNFQTMPKVILKWSHLRALTCAQPTWATGKRNGQCIAQKERTLVGSRMPATGPQVKRRAGKRAYRILLQRCRGAGHEEEKKEGPKGAPKAEIF